MGDLDFLGEGGFDAESVEPAEEFGLIPVGWYPVKVDRVELKVTQRGDGKYLKFMFTILDGSYKNRKVFTQHNIANPSPEAVRIGQSRVSALALAAGFKKLGDSKLLLGKKVDARVVIKKGSGNYGDDNECETYAKLGSKSSAAAQASQAKSAPAPANSGGSSSTKPIWES